MGGKGGGNDSRISTRSDEMTDPKWWDLTIKKSSVDLGNLMEVLDRKCDRWVIGDEVGEGITSYEHYQCRIVCKSPSAMSTVRNFIEEGCPCWEGWVTATSNKGRATKFAYCEKGGNFIRSWEKALRKFAQLELRYWQEQALADLTVQSEREILVIVDFEGNRGKSYLAKHLEVTHTADVCPVTDGDASNYLEYCLNHPSTGYVFDIPKADSIKSKKAMWRAVEQIKNGLLYDRRYTSRKVWIEPPRIIIFTNEYPPLGMLSSDRWKVRRIFETAIEEPHLIPVTADEIRAWEEEHAPSEPKGATA